LLQAGRISLEDGVRAASSRHDFELALQQAGIALPV
jgi:hypothetical protein